MRIATILLTLLLTACSTTSTVYVPPKPAAGQTYGFNFLNQGGDDAAGASNLKSAIRTELSRAGLLGPELEASGLIEVTVTHYYVRSDGARLWAGIMAGRDKIISRVRILDPDGSEVASFEVESTNATALGSTYGFHQKHAEEIASHLRS